MMKRVVLLGFPGSGKSTIAKALARLFHFRAVDLDTEIEKHFHTTIPFFMQKYGEDIFRKCEYQLLLETLTWENIVLATGGGTPCFFDAISKIKNDSISVYIQMSVKSLHSRLSSSKKRRPLIENKDSAELLEYIEKTLAVREPYYMQADLTVKGESIDIRELAEALMGYNLPI